VNKQDYIEKIIKINSYLIPMARCMNFNSALFINFELILSILVIMLIAAYLLTSSVSRIVAMVAILTTIICLCLASLRMQNRTQEYLSQVGQMGQLMEKCCR
jgi:uncharacterized protein YacL